MTHAPAPPERTGDADRRLSGEIVTGSEAAGELVTHTVALATGTVSGSEAALELVSHTVALATRTVTGSEAAGELVSQTVALATGTVTGSEAAQPTGDAKPAIWRSDVTGSVDVALVGGGPGDPDLLTVRAEALLAEAATVVVDVGILHLALAFAPDATIVPVADRTPAVDVLLGAARPVVRLYTGDTWLHPAHGAESAALTEAGVDYEAVAGVATEIALPALAGIAVHVRQLAVACTIADLDHAPTADRPRPHPRPSHRRPPRRGRSRPRGRRPGHGRRRRAARQRRGRPMNGTVEPPLAPEVGQRQGRASHRLDHGHVRQRGGQGRTRSASSPAPRPTRSTSLSPTAGGSRSPSRSTATPPTGASS